MKQQIVPTLVGKYAINYTDCTGQTTQKECKPKTLSLSSAPPPSSLCFLSGLLSLHKRKASTTAMDTEHKAQPQPDSLQPLSSFNPLFVFGLLCFSTQKKTKTDPNWAAMETEHKASPHGHGGFFGAITVDNRCRLTQKNAEDVHRCSPLFNHRDLSSRHSTVVSEVAITQIG